MRIYFAVNCMVIFAIKYELVSFHAIHIYNDIVQIIVQSV